MAEEEGKNPVVWPDGAEKVENIADFEFFMAGRKNKPVMKIEKEKLNEFIVINGEAVKAVAGGASSSAPTILRPGPTGQNRKMEKVKGWFVNGTSAEPPVATGTPWQAPEGFDNTNWWDGTTKVWSLGSTIPIPKGADGVNGKTVEPYNPTKENGYAFGDQVFFNSAIWQATTAASTGQSPDTNPEKWGLKPVLKSGIQYLRKEIILKDYISATNKRYTTSSNGGGYVITDVVGRVILSGIDVTEGATYIFKGTTIDSGNANALRFWVDGKGDRIATLEDTRISPLTHVAPRDAKKLMLSYDSANEIANATLTQITDELTGYPLKQTYSVGYNLSNGYVKNYELKANGSGVAPSGQRSYISTLIPIVPNTSYSIFGNYYSFGQVYTAYIYDKDFNLISYFPLTYESRAITTSMVALLFTFVSPENAKYVRYDVVRGPTQADNFETIPTSVHYFFKSEHWRLILQPENPFYELTASRIDSIFQKQLPVQKQLSEETYLIFGTSIENTQYAQSTIPYEGSKLKGTTGGWIGRFLDLVRPKKFYNYAAGGYTLTDTSGKTGSDLATGGTNSFLKQLEIFINDYSASGSNMTPPTTVLICGCTNDFGQSQPRYITDAEVTASGKSYDKHVEELFYLQSDLPTYDNNRLIPLETINLAKIHGALRYIVQRLGTLFPGVKFFIVTPIQSTAHSLFQQRMCVRDYKWTANRLSIPVIDAWGESQLTMLWDYKDINGNDNHKLLVDNVHMANATVVQNSVNIMARFVANSIYSRFFKF